jgi:hypothetical protein
VRRAERAEVPIEVDRTGALPETYHDLFQTSVERWAARQHEPTGSPLVVLTMAYVEDRPAYGSIMLLGETAHVTRSAMDVELVGSTMAGSLVQRIVLQLVCAEDCRSYHLGESGQTRVRAQFKQSVGAVGNDYAEYRYERLPYTRADQLLRSAATNTLRFRDV